MLADIFSIRNDKDIRLVNQTVCKAAKNVYISLTIFSVHVRAYVWS